MRRFLGTLDVCHTSNTDKTASMMPSRLVGRKVLRRGEQGFRQKIAAAHIRSGKQSYSDLRTLTDAEILTCAT
jgi:hypothetical protein